jgi:PPM family protein phosphatase
MALAATKRSRTLVRYAGHSESGRVRSINQDSFFVGEAGGGYLAVVADGMGGHSTGEVASQKAVEIIRREIEASRSYPPAALARAVQSANREIFEYAADNAEHHGMGTTLTSVFIDDQIGLVGHIGDSRVYLVRDGGIQQLTFDHSWVAERVRQGILTQDEAKHHRLRNVITNALGALPKVKLDLSHMDVRPGDRLLLCSDGVSMLLSDEQLLGVVSRGTPEDAVRELLEEANRRGSPDNITAVVLHVETVEARVKRYALPPKLQEEPRSVTISGTVSGVRWVEETFPKQDALSRLRRHPWYPYRLWILGSLYLLTLIVVFSLWQP